MPISPQTLNNDGLFAQNEEFDVGEVEVQSGADGVGAQGEMGAE